MSTQKLTCRIIALNYNGKELLREFLPGWIAAAKASTFPCQVTVLDNQSMDGSADFVAQHFPEVHIFRAKENRVLCSYNDIAETLTEDILIFLNNDIQTEREFVDPLIRPFTKRDDIFFTVPRGCRAIPKSRWGTISASFDYPEYESLMEKPGYVYATGSGAFDRKKFLELGGYDPLYLPGYYEDVDLCHRGWKKGWVGYCTPDSRVHHVGSVSFNKHYSAAEKQALVCRNSVFFMVKNISDAGLLIQFVLGTIVRIFWALLSGKFFIVRGILRALKRLPEVCKLRAASPGDPVLSDRKIFQTIQNDLTQSPL